MYQIAICDDDSKFILYMKNIISKIKKEICIEYKVYEYLSGEELFFVLEDGPHFDLLILDIQLGDIDGRKIAKSFREHFPDAVLVFCSGVYSPDDEDFKVTPYRYLLKNKSCDDLTKDMGEVIREMECRHEEPFILGHYRGVQRKIKLKDILYIENSKRGGEVILHPNCNEMSFDKKILVYKKPKELEKEIQKFGFALVRSSCIVNMNHIDYIDSNSGVFDTGDTFDIARAYQKPLKDAFAKYFSDKYL